MFKREKPKLIKFYGFESPDGSGILYGSTDPKEAAELVNRLANQKKVKCQVNRDLFQIIITIKYL